MNNQYLGSNFDDFLAEKGLLAVEFAQKILEINRNKLLDIRKEL